VKFSDVLPREDDDDKTWRGDDAWRTNVGEFKFKGHILSSSDFRLILIILISLAKLPAR
jgi:hypothetical protein